VILKIYTIKRSASNQFTKEKKALFPAKREEGFELLLRLGIRR